MKLWQDVNQDGVSQAGELLTLADKGIASIALNETVASTNLGNGNSVTGTAVVTRTNGGTTQVDSVSLDASNLVLANNPFYREFTDVIPLTAAARALPEMGGSGWTRNLREAMSLGSPASTSLQDATSLFAQGATRESQLAAIDGLISTWADTTGRQLSYSSMRVDAHLSLVSTSGTVQTIRVTPAEPADAPGLFLADIRFRFASQTFYNPSQPNMAPALNARGVEVMQRLAALEAFNGTRFVDFTFTVSSGSGGAVGGGSGGGGGVADPVTHFGTTISDAQVGLIDAAYDTLRNSIYDGLVTQTRLRPYLEGVELIVSEAGVQLDAAPLAAKLAQQHTLSEKTAVEDLAELLRYASPALMAAGFDGTAMLRSWIDATPPDSPIRATLHALNVWWDGTVVGTVHRDIFVGGANADSFNAGDGDDVVSGPDGNDALYGEFGRDILLGGAGNDTLSGYIWWNNGRGDANDGDIYDGGAGNDDLRDLESSNGDVYRLGLGGGHDVVEDNGGTGDAIELGSGVAATDVTVRSDGGRIKVALATGESILVGGLTTIEEIRFADGTVWDAAAIRQQATTGSALADQMSGFVGDDTMTGGAGADDMYGDAGHDLIDGGSDNDSIQGGAGRDTLIGGAGNDLLLGKIGWNNGAGDPNDADVYDGGAGNDDLRDLESSNGDVYRLGLGGGQDVVEDNGGTGDAIELGIGIATEAVTLSVDNNRLNVVVASGESMVVSGTSTIEEIRFADGTIWDQATLIARATSVAPVVANPIADQTTAEDAAFGFTVPANAFTDADAGQLLSFAARLWDGSALPAWLVFDAATRTFSGTPANAQVGAVQIRVTATDPLGLSASDVFAVTVTNTNDAPIVAAPVAAQAATQGQAFSLTVPVGTFADVDVGDTLSYSLTKADGSALPAWLTFNASTRVLSGTPANGDVGVTGMRLTATDAAGATAATSFNLTVANVNDAPVLSAALVDQVGQAGTEFTYTVPAGAFTDIDAGDTLSYSAKLADGSALPAWLSFNAATRSFTGTPSAVGTTSVRVTAIDGSGLAASDVFDVVVASANRTLTGTTPADTLTGGIGDDTLSGLAGNDSLVGGSGNDLLDGGAGNDTMVGGAGNDIYVVDSATDVVTELVGEGTDTVQSSVTLTLAANVENLTLMGATALNGTGNTLDDWLVGNSAANTLTGAAGNDTLDGGAGTDSLVGGAGDDVYIVDVTADAVTEAASAGTDTVRSSVTWTLGSNVENLVLTGTSAINGTGNTVANVLTGSSANNTLDGGTGADTLIGGAGNDTYTVDNTGDVVTELAGGGTDLVNSSVTYTLTANVENLTLTGTTAINGTGNALDNLLTGNSASNTLTGGAGNDTIDGGTGNDTYVVNVATDVATELAGEGTDTVQSSVTLTLGANVENLVLTGTTAINGTGNTLDNVLTGNSANNTLTGAAGNDTLDGGVGNDTMVGGAGNDVYYANVSTDVVAENASEGTDTVNAAVTWTLGSNLENLALTGTSAINGTGNALDNWLSGNSVANTLTGAAGNDTLDGAGGNDILVGGAGADSYRFGRGWGVDTVQENDATAGVKDVVSLQGSGSSAVLQADVQFSQAGNNLEMLIRGTTDKLVLTNWYLGSQYHAEEFRFTDGSVLTDTQAQALVGAMAGSAAAPSGSSLTSSPMVGIGAVTLAVSAV